MNRMHDYQVFFLFIVPKASLWVCVGEGARKLTQFTLSALEPRHAVAHEGVASVHTRTPVLTGKTAAVLGQLCKTTAAIIIHSTEWVGGLRFQAHNSTLSTADIMCW